MPDIIRCVLTTMPYLSKGVNWATAVRCVCAVAAESVAQKDVFVP